MPTFLQHYSQACSFYHNTHSVLHNQQNGEVHIHKEFCTCPSFQRITLVNEKRQKNVGERNGKNIFLKIELDSKAI